jgi:hypothetical protein
MAMALREYHNVAQPMAVVQSDRRGVNAYRGVVTPASSIQAADDPEQRRLTFAQSSGSMAPPGASYSVAIGGNTPLVALLGNAYNVIHRPPAVRGGVSSDDQDSTASRTTRGTSRRRTSDD